MLIGIVVIYIASAILQNFVGVPVTRLFALDPLVLGPQTLWQVLTHVAIEPPTPNSVLSLLLTLLFMWWILSPFEERYGRERLLQLTLVAAVASAVPAVVVGQTLPAYSSFVAGPHGVLLAGLTASAVVLPAHAQLSFFGLFTLTPRQLIYLIIAVSVVSFLTSLNGAQLGADLGAIGGAVLFVRYWMQRPPPSRTFKGGKRKGRRDSGRIRLVRDDDDEPKRWLN